ncbi:AAA family ATPase [Amnibacterium flavum]|uniref:AAA family ATPase n=1 Tax=Amnibacterium flavum TaxID=2173173 RepID=A0A2V1HS45_9MICO|nr:AAA family ATPase [Amnibacterium flavum]PVZ95161.1 AAA family ATPase [Amnibacterium flavum]
MSWETGIGRMARPIRRVEEHPLEPMPRGVWPATVPAVEQILDHGLDLSDVTVLVGDNGAGKSTIVEAVALAFGLSPEGGSTAARHSTRESESSLSESLQLVRGPGASKFGYFLRAETMHGFFTYLERIGPGARFHEMSHGESFIELVLAKFRGRGLWVLDEPESALSFSGCLALIGVLRALIDEGGSQVLLSTHSPLLAALPGATIYEVGEWGLRESVWDDLDLVRSWRSFLDAPDRFLRLIERS